MRHLIVVLLLASLPAASAPLYSQQFRVDLNGDGAAEVVALKPFVQDGVTLQQLVVLDRRGKVIWAGPRRSAEPQWPSEPLVFGGEFDLGNLQAVGDLDGDGAVEALGTWQKSDVSPTRFRLLRWQGGRFVHVRSGNLLPAPQRPGTWTWQDRPEATTWLDEVEGMRPDGTLEVRIVDMGSGAEPMKVVVRGTEEGFQVAR